MYKVKLQCNEMSMCVGVGVCVCVFVVVVVVGERRKFTDRSGKQCRERWVNHLQPNIRKECWTSEEEELLVHAHSTFGNRWSAIAKVSKLSCVFVCVCVCVCCYLEDFSSLLHPTTGHPFHLCVCVCVCVSLSLSLSQIAPHPPYYSSHKITFSASLSHITHTKEICHNPPKKSATILQRNLPQSSKQSWPFHNFLPGIVDIFLSKSSLDHFAWDFLKILIAKWRVYPTQKNHWFHGFYLFIPVNFVI